MRNATCVGTQTSKVPTRVTLLFIFYSVAKTCENILNSTCNKHVMMKDLVSAKFLHKLEQKHDDLHCNSNELPDYLFCSLCLHGTTMNNNLQCTQPESPQTCCTLWILPACYNFVMKLQQVG